MFPFATSAVLVLPLPLGLVLGLVLAEAEGVSVMVSRYPLRLLRWVTGKTPVAEAC